MAIKLHNTLTKKKSDFEPIDKNNVGMYACGPTVYSRAHIGNARAAVAFDALFRVLIHEFGKENVTYVRNITDVDDKINKAAKERNIPISELTVETTKMFHEDMAALNCLEPTVEPRATEHITEMQDMCHKLINRGNAYEAEGHVLFDVKTDPHYGHLSRRSREEMVAGARVEVAPYKKDPADFVLWKPSADDEPGWDSPWGRGRPGWHIECSVMSTKYLGETFDIHGGGADLQFPHHENEIAQSCCANPGSEYAKYWVHNGFLSVEGEKMSKSLGNFITPHELLVEKGIKGYVIRYALLATHYRKPLDWNEKAVQDAEKSIDKFLSVICKDGNPSEASKPTKDFVAALNDDLNTPLAISIMHELAKKDKPKKLRACCELLGIFTQSDLEEYCLQKATISDEDSSRIEELIQLRKTARDEKNWAESDRIRDELAAEGITLKDNPDGTTSWSK